MYIIFKLLVSGFNQIPQNGMFKQTVEPIAASVCPHETAHGRSYECITGIMYAQTHIHVPRNKLIVA